MDKNKTYNKPNKCCFYFFYFFSQQPLQQIQRQRLVEENKQKTSCTMQLLIKLSLLLGLELDLFIFYLILDLF